MFAQAYRAFAFLGLMIVGTSYLTGFRYDAEAPVENYWINFGMYAAYIVVHIIMTMPGFKKALYRQHAGKLIERQIYIVISIVTWLAVFYYHKAVPGFEFASPDWLQFLGICAVMLAAFGFFEFATFDALDSLVGMPGTEISHTVSADTPLFTEGSYARVRHPMYRAGFLMGFVSLLIHPNAGQLLFAVMLGFSFVLFVPFEEHQLIKARGKEYKAYMKATPWRVFRGIW